MTGRNEEKKDTRSKGKYWKETGSGNVLIAEQANEMQGQNWEKKGRLALAKEVVLAHHSARREQRAR